MIRSFSAEPGVEPRVSKGRITPQFIGILVIVGVLVSAALLGSTIFGQLASGEPTSDNKHDPIKATCRIHRGDELAKLLGFPEALFKRDSVYVVGYVLNLGKKTAYVKARIQISADELSSWGDVTISVIPPNGTKAEPFLARMGTLIDPDIELENVRVSFEVKEVTFK